MIEYQDTMMSIKLASKRACYAAEKLRYIDLYLWSHALYLTPHSVELTNLLITKLKGPHESQR